jgi:hypothetical protein
MGKLLMDMNDFLSRRGTDVISVIESVKNTIGLGPKDLLLAVGSIVEGLGTNKSDLDLFLISQRTIPAQDSRTMVVGKCLIDLRLVSLSGYVALCSRVEDWSRAQWNVTQAVKFSLDNRTLLHRALHGRVLYNGSANDIALPMPQNSTLALLKLNVARQMARTIQVDMVGYCEIGDYRSLCFAAQELLGQVVDALCAGHLLTNPLLKWRSRMLDRLPVDWERSLTMRPSGVPASEFVWRLHCGPEVPDEKSSVEFALRITTFARVVFSWAELHLIGESSSKHELQDWPLNDWSSQVPTLPQLIFDVDFVFSGGHVKVARLNDFGGSIDVLPDEFALVLLCDGATTVREAEIVICGENEDLTARLNQLLTEIRRAGFTFDSVLESRPTEGTPDVALA